MALQPHQDQHLVNVTGDSGLSLPRPGTLPKESPEWDLYRQLQTTLDTDSLLGIFHETARRLLQIDATEYQNEAVELALVHGKPARHSTRYSLTVADQNIGTVIFSRGRRFAGNDLTTLENLLCLLVYPLRNCLMYHEALTMALRDALTGALNRSAMDTMLGKEVELSHRHGTPLSMLIMDIDHFKRINDKHGHSVGDAALRILAKQVQDCCRGADSLFRYGGEEFVLLLSNTDIAGARLLAERIRHSVENMFVVHDNLSLKFTISIGVGSLRANEKAEQFFDRTDTALYSAKTAGRNRLQLAE